MNRILEICPIEDISLLFRIIVHIPQKQQRFKRKYLGRVNPQTGENIRSRREEQLPNAVGGKQAAVLLIVMELQKELATENARIGQLEEEWSAILRVNFRKIQKESGTGFFCS